MTLYPTRRAIVLALAGAPVALLISAAAPGLWIVAAGWVLLTAGLLVADAALAAPTSSLTLSVAAPEMLGVGRAGVLQVDARFDGSPPRALELAVDVDDRL